MLPGAKGSASMEVWPYPSREWTVRMNSAASGAEMAERGYAMEQAPLRPDAASPDGEPNDGPGDPERVTVLVLEGVDRWLR